MDDGIRLQIIGIRVETAGIFATGSLAMDFLGLIGTCCGAVVLWCCGAVVLWCCGAVELRKGTFIGWTMTNHWCEWQLGGVMARLDWVAIVLPAETEMFLTAPTSAPAAASERLTASAQSAGSMVA